jgi:DNA-directed RNA polymerase specialized sigma24 family protein
MKPTYEVRAWREHGWWLARVVAAGEGADPAPLHALAHARSLITIEQTARDLVAMILDTHEEAFDIEIEYVLPDEIETAVYEAIGARTWLDAAQQLWQEQSAAAVYALSGQGFSPQETAKVLGLSDQRVGRLLASSSAMTPGPAAEES